MGTRRECRERLVALFTATGSFSKVHGFAKPDLEGMSPVMCIYVSKTFHRKDTADMTTNLYTYILDVHVKRKSTENSEDTLDDLRTVIQTVVDANIGDSEWQHLHLEEMSDAYFAEISGVPYRVESHPVTVKTH